MEIMEAALFVELGPMAGGLGNLLGMTVMFIGWFYVMGGRTGAESFALATVVDRLLVPFFIAPFLLAGDVPVMAVAAFGVIDPLLAVGALIIWRRTKEGVDG